MTLVNKSQMMDMSMVVATDTPCATPSLSLNVFSGVVEGAVTR